MPEMFNVFGSQRCANTEPHEPHHFLAEIAKYCSGKTSCGEAIHSPHNFSVQEEVGCPGVCGCGIPGYPVVHGPGEHK